MPKTKTSIGGKDEPPGSASKKRRISETENSSASSGSENTQQHGNDANQLKPQTNDEMPPMSKKETDAGHGHRFQSKLLMLFCIRAINEEYEFYLGTELAEQGKKFDDLIFKYNKDKNADKTGDNWSYKYLQAKSRLNEKVDKIRAKDLFAVRVKDKKINVDFSLPKYFRSYLEIKKRGDKIDSCIICTNIDFASQKDLWNNGIKVKEVQQTDPILKFEKQSGGKTPKHYKIEIAGEKLSDKLIKESDSKRLAQMLLDWINKKIKLNSKSELMRYYHMALVNENVIDITTKQFHMDFIEGSDGLSEGAKELRQHFMEFNTNSWKNITFSLDENFGKEPTQPQMFDSSPITLPVAEKEIVGFLDKLIFAVNTPNESELDIILTKGVSKYYELQNTDLQSAFVMNEMVNWFKRKKNLWLSSEEAKKLFLNKTKNIMESLRETAISIDYQKQLKKFFEFNDEAIGKMIEKLEKLFVLIKNLENNIVRINTQVPKRTAVKVIAALEKLKENSKPKNLTATNNKISKDYFQYEDSYLVTSSSRMKNNPFKFESNNSHNLLVVVCEDGPSTETDEFCQKLLKKMPKKRVIIISQDKGEVEVKDELNFSDLSEKSQRVLLEKEIEFQGSLQSVGDLIKRRDTTLDGLIKKGGAEKILDFNSIEELLIAGKTIEIPSGSSAKFEKNLYIERQLEFPFANFNDFYDQLAKKLKCTKDELQNEFKLDSQGNIEWFVEDDGEKKIKEKENKNSINSPSANDDATPEEEVTNTNENRKGKVKKSRKKEIWEKMKKIVKENSGNSPSSIDDTTPEEDLITRENRKGKVFILDGIAGTGKSTILSNYYEKIKKENPDTWVIRIDLVDYPNELKDFSTVYQGSGTEFFLNLFAPKSPFTRSLLTHRFETDGRIVVMLDGFDEIGDELRKKLFKLVTAIKLTKVDALYLTTRSHLKEELEDKLFQISYTLKKFSEKDQIDCLFKYWTSKLKMQNKVKEKSIQSFGERLVKGLSKTLKDKERDFIGIPLQCRMLAEIYETQLNQIKEKLQIDSLIENIPKTDLDLTSLYSLFMEKKFEIYVSQKLKTDISNDQLNFTIEHIEIKLEKYLTKLAIKTIVFYSDDADVLLGKSKFVSRKEMSQEEEHFTDVGVRCGFLGKDDKGEKKFLHRTYAEYLFAKYLHDGFLPEEDENYNKLLTSQPVREMIFRTIFMDEQYEGVRMFFNSFLIKVKVKPMANLSREIKKYDEIVGVAIRDQNANLFTFLCDCLDLSLKKVEIQKIMQHNDIYYGTEERKAYGKPIMYRMYTQNSKVFERFISYYDDENADKKEVKFILQQMFHMDLKNVGESEPNQKEMKKIIQCVISFFGRNRETTKQILNQTIIDEMIYDPEFIVNALLFKECYSSHLQPFLELLSSVYCEDTEFEKFLLKKITKYEYEYYISTGNLGKTLTILSDLKRNEVLRGISCKIFRMDVQLFKRFYQPKKEARADGAVLLPPNIQSFLERDSDQMTRLYRSALHGDEETVGQILEMVRKRCSSPNKKTKKKGMEVLHKVFVKDEEENEKEENKEGITPLYVAAACEHENIFKQMLKFLKDVLPKDKLTYYVTKKNGILSNALWDAIKWKKVGMLRIILISFKEILGQKYLIRSIEGIIFKIKDSHIYYTWEKILFQIIVEVIVDGENGYKDLNDFLFENNGNILSNFSILSKIKQFQHINSKTLQGMLKVNGMDAWMKRLLDTNLRTGFDIVLDHLLEKLNAEQRPQLLRLIISENSHQKSYWDRGVDEFFFRYKSIDPERVSSLMHFTQFVSDNRGQCVIKELLTRNDNRIIKEALFHGGEELVNKMLSFLSNEKDVISIEDLASIVSKFIKDAVDDKLKDKGFKEGMRNILDFVFDYVEKFDLSKLVETISYNYTDCHGDNIWSLYVKQTYREEETMMLRIDNFLKYIKDKIGPSAVEKLVVEHEHGDFIQNILLFKKNKGDVVAVLLQNLSQEKRKEIGNKLVENAPTIMTNLKKIGEATDYFYEILQFVKDAGTNELLKLIESITSKTFTEKTYYPKQEEKETCVWSYFVSTKYSCELSYELSYNYDQYFQKRLTILARVDEFLQCVSKNKDLGSSAVEKLVVEHENGDFIHRILADTENDENLVNVLLRHLSEEKWDEIEQQLVKEAPEKIKNLWRKKWQCGNYWANILQCVVKHADGDELLRLIERITQSYNDNQYKRDKRDKSRKTSIWRSYLLEDDNWYVNKDLRSQNVDKFLQRVSKKLGKRKVKELVMHKCDDGMAVLHYVKYYRKDASLVEAMLAHLTAEDREEVWCEPPVDISEEGSGSSDEEISDEEISEFESNSSDEESESSDEDIV